MNNPIATYRIQFHKDFSFSDLEKRVSYLQKLGVSTLYASPIFAASKGSTHGYDGISPEVINPEIGTVEQLRKLSETLKQLEISWLQDIVPNHMAFHSENEWLMDVLEKGQQSEYASFFDIAWNSKLFQGKLMVPFLGAPLEEVIDNQQVKVEYAGNRLVLNYEGATFPLNIRSYMNMLGTDQENAPETIHQLVKQLNEIHEAEDPKIFSQRWSEFLLQLSSLMKNEKIKSWIDQEIQAVNADKSKITELVKGQEYILCFWQDTDSKINFRRFFTVNGLICLNMHYDTVFDKYHEFISQLVDEGIFQGLRVDHIDGLYDPAGYLEKLRELAGPETYLIVEKILEKSESLPVQWPIEGTSGYEFLADVNNVFTNSDAEEAFSKFYQDITDSGDPIREQLLEKKSGILNNHMGGELDNLYQLFTDLELVALEKLEDVGRDNVKKAIGEFLIHCPVYRYYGNQMPLSETENQEVKAVFEDVKAHHAGLDSAIQILEEAILEKAVEGDEAYNTKVLEFYQRLMQFSGPLMAKGGEDTLMYTYNRFIGHNDVGDFPDRFGMPVKEFHHKMRLRQKDWPLALNSTSTHDTKRGEDVRARLNVLTDLHEDWIAKVNEWRTMNTPIRKPDGPTDNDEYLIYQTLAGAYPMPGEDATDFAERLGDYLKKALREAKTDTTWAEPNEVYEKSTEEFALSLLDTESPFFASFQEYLKTISDAGIVNSLSQVLLKFTCPGIPDVYQGTELWDLSLVDPDNRRPFDYEIREQWLREFEDYNTERLGEKLWETRNSGQIKLWLTHQLYQLRKSNPVLVSKGDYVPLKIRGAYKEHILAFARKFKKDYLVVAVPLHSAVLCKEQGTTFFDLDWKDTSIVLPDNMEPNWADALTGEEAEYEGKLTPADIFRNLPVAVLKGKKPDNERKAGVLLHITSLASPFGIGDMGPEAFAFADFLANSSQKLWQILPLNPIEAAQSNSPYSALSSRAGNPLLISPEILVQEGLLEAEKLAGYELPQTGKTDYDQAGKLKDEILREAFDKFLSINDAEANDAFEAFCEKNQEWLDDFALYMALKKQHEGKPWYTWAEQYRKRDESALAALDSEKLQFIKWEQYIFDKQWKALKSYCNDMDIKLLGDIPFYVSYDSADVWANPEYFCVDEEGKITGIAGVPPDAFSDDGQLWGMPVFNWGALKKQDYQWWVQRLAKNVELFDIVRLDHFRAFTDYWEVPGGEKTAINGEWKLGPDAEFFTKIATELGGLPFVAEDLGEMSPGVYKLRDKFALPGMKVLQFAFSENMPQSDHIPHNFNANFYAYTGTHDNNTTLGWFRASKDDDTKGLIEKYVGYEVNEENICDVMARLTFSSVAKVAMLPMQDVLKLDETTIMNIPGSNENNWSWRLKPGQVTQEAQQFLLNLTTLYNRD
ncbi:malto-oligosyltrehalose synthase [Dyadobacter chenwenxiniae]|uniref:4-alpha-glucanotransferase n=1 Tax=Dyadobacter chenwenxiniae TaxID=2906456 RepID=A0A9X1PPM1_9BACT|nr:malto-oligosyltrehalose synthase [Dyadobacter chenwenxiniae]MCF0062481.1 malto-oligosyltrehalose synthase [Dyadobacter chenwenxiniae]UON83771.1 malto-oligosyltrehalose synthase [Dyadobacter chenwenxiniae]